MTRTPRPGPRTPRAYRRTPVYVRLRGLLAGQFSRRKPDVSPPGRAPPEVAPEAAPQGLARRFTSGNRPMLLSLI